MASKKSSGGRSSSGKKKTSRSGSTSPRFAWESEVLLFVTLIFCVLIFIANLGKAGSIGTVISKVLFGLFGVMSYAFPFALFIFVAFLISHRTVGKKSKYHYPGRAVIKSLAGIFCFVFLCVIFHTFRFSGITYGVRGNYLVCSAQMTGGGMIGGIFSVGMVRGIGVAATYVISVLILLLCVVLISERSLFRGLFRRFYDSRDEARDRAESGERKRSNERSMRREAGSVTDRRDSARQSRRDRREPVDFYDEGGGTQPRRDRKVSGVSPDVILKPQPRQPEKSDEVPEDSLGGTGRMSEMDLSDIDYGDFLGSDEDEEIDAPVIRVSRNDPSEDAGSGVQSGKPEKKKTAAETKKKKQPTHTMKEVTQEVADIAGSVAATSGAEGGEYVFPSTGLLKKGDPKKSGDSRQHLSQMASRLQETFDTFNVKARVTNVICGPSVTQFEIQPEMGVKVKKITDLADDIKLNLMVSDIRIEAPIPGKAAIGIEVPNKENVTVALRELIESEEYRTADSGITFCVGKDIAGHIIVGDITEMPHLLIAGATGSGKSVCINTIIMSILYKYTPDEVRLIMIDPKVVELSVYNEIPHLLIPVVTDPKKAAGALNWAVAEMTERYKRFADCGVRDIGGYNKRVDAMKDEEVPEGEERPQRLPDIVIIVDELSDLMMVAKGDVEDAICRLAQLARAAGLYLIIATQRPSVNVITGLIKANMPSRIAFAVASGVDSRTILNMNGAETLLGKGDMLYHPQGYSKPLRVQGAFVSDGEVARVVDDIVSRNGQVAFDEEIENKVSVSGSESGGAVAEGFPSTNGSRDVYFDDAARFLIEKEKGSIGMLQRNFKIGFNRAARIMDQLEDAGIVGPEEGTKPRRVLVTIEEYESMED